MSLCFRWIHRLMFLLISVKRHSAVRCSCMLARGDAYWCARDLMLRWKSIIYLFIYFDEKVFDFIARRSAFWLWRNYRSARCSMHRLVWMLYQLWCRCMHFINCMTAIEQSFVFQMSPCDPIGGIVTKFNLAKSKLTIWCFVFWLVAHAIIWNFQLTCIEYRMRLFRAHLCQYTLNN